MWFLWNRCRCETVCDINYLLFVTFLVTYLVRHERLCPFAVTAHSHKLDEHCERLTRIVDDMDKRLDTFTANIAEIDKSMKTIETILCILLWDTLLLLGCCVVFDVN